MLTFTDFELDLRSIPGEICLTFYICDCPCHCHGCSSPWLWERGKYELNAARIIKAINLTPYATCILFMGGDNDLAEVAHLAQIVRGRHKKAAFYSGRDTFDPTVCKSLDYYKIGHWDAAAGPLNSPTTNQALFKRTGDVTFTNITSKFWTRENEWKPQQEEDIKKNRTEWLQGRGADDAKRSPNEN